MAGLGIAAGAFDGDNERKSQQQRDQQLALQGASLAQQQQQANMANERALLGLRMEDRARRENMAFQRDQMAESGRRFDAGQALDTQRQAEQVRQFDLGLGMQQAGLQRQVQNDQFMQDQTLRRNDWEDVLNTQKLKEGELQYQELLKLRDEEERQRQQRDAVAKSAVGQMIRLAYEGGGVPGKNFLSASQLDYFKKSDPRFQGLQTVTWGDDGKGGKVLQMIMQGPNGEPVAETITPEQQYMALSSLYGQKMADGVFGRVDKAAYNAYLTDRGGSLLSKDSRQMSKIDELNYAALAKQNAEMPGVPEIVNKMRAIEARYGIEYTEPEQKQIQEPQKPADPYALKKNRQQADQVQKVPDATVLKIGDYIKSVLANDQNEGMRLNKEADRLYAQGMPLDKIYETLTTRGSSVQNDEQKVQQKVDPKQTETKKGKDIPSDEELNRFGIRFVYGKDGKPIKAEVGNNITGIREISVDDALAQYKSKKQRQQDLSSKRAQDEIDRQKAEEESRKRYKQIEDEYTRRLCKGFGY